MTRAFGSLLVVLMMVCAPPRAQAGVLSKFFGELFSGWGSKAASESAEKATARGAARSSSKRAGSGNDGLATRASKTALEQAAQQRLQDVANDRRDGQRRLQPRRLNPRMAR